MATNFKPWKLDGEQGVHYTFDKAGEGISMHAHVEPNTRHDTRCLVGSCELYGDGLSLTLKAGETAKFKSYRMHEIVALQDGTELVNVFNEQNDAELSGSVDSPLYGRSMFGET
jgi:hypothetical protein